MIARSTIQLERQTHGCRVYDWSSELRERGADTRRQISLFKSGCIAHHPAAGDGRHPAIIKHHDLMIRDLTKGIYPSPLLRTSFENQLVAYGGGDGRLFLLLPDDVNEKPRAIREYVHNICALSLSQNGKRVAIGFQNDSTRIYCYDNCGAGSMGLHPFIINSDKYNCLARGDNSDSSIQAQQKRQENRS